MQHEFGKIRSFVLRAGRMSQRQQFALDNWLKEYELCKEHAPWDLKSCFGRDAETILEIGFGMGQSLANMAMNRPDQNFIGIEVHQPGIGSLTADLHDKAISNVRIVTFDAVLALQQYLPDQSLDGVQIFFPDPWPKTRHHKRRLIQSEFIQLLTRKIKRGGFIHCATDWEDYALQMEHVLNHATNLRNQNVHGGFSPKPATRPLTKFEQRGRRLGHGVWDLIYTIV